MVKKFILLITVLFACGSTVFAMAPDHAGPAEPSAVARLAMPRVDHSAGGQQDNAGIRCPAPARFNCGLCPICWNRNCDDGDQTRPVRELDCHHKFCKSCIDRWTTMAAWCPVCHAGTDPERPDVFLKFRPMQDADIQAIRRASNQAARQGLRGQELREAIFKNVYANDNIFAADVMVPGYARNAAEYECARVQGGQGNMAACRQKAEFSGNTYWIWDLLRDRPNRLFAIKFGSDLFWKSSWIRRHFPVSSCGYHAGNLIGYVHLLWQIGRPIRWRNVLAFTADLGACWMGIRDMRAAAAGWDKLSGKMAKMKWLLPRLMDCSLLIGAVVNGMATEMFRHTYLLKHDVNPKTSSYIMAWGAPLFTAAYVGYRQKHG